MVRAASLDAPLLPDSIGFSRPTLRSTASIDFIRSYAAVTVRVNTKFVDGTQSGQPAALVCSRRPTLLRLVHT